MKKIKIQQLHGTKQKSWVVAPMERSIIWLAFDIEDFEKKKCATLASNRSLPKSHQQVSKDRQHVYD